MCRLVIVDGEEVETIGELSRRLGAPSPRADQCLCCCDVEGMAKAAGAKCKDVRDDDRGDLFWVDYIITTTP